MNRLFLLDTNAASAALRQREPLRSRCASLPLSSLAISSVTAAELLYGVAKNPSATNLARLVQEFLRNIDVLPWDQSITPIYGTLRASLEAEGITVAALDFMIAAHALAIDATLVTSDAIFARIPSLKIENWMDP